MFPKKISDCKYKAFVDGEIRDVSLQDYAGRYVVLVFYPLDFTFVCPTEINRISDLKEEFQRRNAVVLLVSCDSVYTHKAWSLTPRGSNGVQGVAWPMVWDAKRELCNQFGMFDDESGHPMRGTVILSKDLAVKHVSANYHAIGRSVDEILRMLDALAFNDEHGEVCPVEWKRDNKSY